MTVKRALLVGINYYRTPECLLRGCIDDVVDIRKVLIEQYNYLPENIITLRDDTENVAEHPTGANMLNSLNKLVQESGPDDEIWFHYSGHGSQIPDQSSYRESKMDDIIVPMDYKMGGFISDMQLLGLIIRIKCRTVLIFDCCHSGTVCDLPWMFEFSMPDSCNRVKTSPFQIDNPHIYMFSGCKDNEVSADAYDVVHQEPSGAFTCAFIAVLEEAGYTIHLMDLYKKVCARLARQGYSQHPLFSCSHHEPAHVMTREMA
jgi:hypothetical protein